MNSNVSECLAWKLDPSEYSINDDETLRINYKNITMSKSEYFLSGKNDVYVCIPVELRPPFYYMDLIYVCAWMISSIFLILSIIIHCVKSKVKANRALLCHEISLIANYLTSFSYNVVGPDKISPYVPKYFGSYTCLCAFYWLVVFNYDKWKQLRPKNITGISTSSLTFCLQSLFAWFVPALIVGGTTALGLVRVNEDSCENLGFHQNFAEEIFVCSTTEIVLVVNIVLFILTVRNLHRYGKSISRVNQKIFRQLSLVYLKLMIVTGLIWIFTVVEWALMLRTPGNFWIAVDFISALQGFFIFLVYHANCKE